MTQGGGFAGLVRTTVVDAAELAPADAAALRARVDEAGLFESRPAGNGGRPDAEVYEITVEDGDRRHTVVAAEPDLPVEARELLAWLRTVPGHRETIGPPG